MNSDAFISETEKSFSFFFAYISNVKVICSYVTGYTLGSKSIVKLNLLEVPS